MDLNKKQEEFMALYEPCREGLVRFAKAMARNNDEAMDLVQEATLKAFDSFHTLKNPVAFKSWMFTIASRIYKRTNWRKRIFSVFSSDEESDRVFENLTSAESSPDSGYDVQVLYQALDKIPEKQKEAVILYEINGLSMEDIREIQGGSLPGVKSRVQRGRKALEKILRAGDGDEQEAISGNNSSKSKKNNGAARNENLKKLTYAGSDT